MVGPVPPLSTSLQGILVTVPVCLLLLFLCAQFQPHWLHLELTPASWPFICCFLCLWPCYRKWTLDEADALPCNLHALAALLPFLSFLPF